MVADTKLLVVVREYCSACSKNCSAIWAKCDTIYRGLGVIEGALFPPCCYVPDFRRLVFACSYNEAPVGTISCTPHLVGVPKQGMNHLSSSRIPDFGCLIRTRRYNKT